MIGQTLPSSTLSKLPLYTKHLAITFRNQGFLQPFMKKYPQLKFLIDPGREIEIYFMFSRQAKSSTRSRLMSRAFYGPHPKLTPLRGSNLSENQKRSILRSYINAYYEKHLSRIQKNMRLVRKLWERRKDRFFKLINRIFNNPLWPRGQYYVAYPTIWGMCPFDTRNKIIWFPFDRHKTDYLVAIIAHEMLHLIFYDYLYQRYSKYRNEKYFPIIWPIAEGFNMFIQSRKEWRALFGQRPEPLPEHKPVLKRVVRTIRKIWSEKQNISYLLEKIFQDGSTPLKQFK